MSFPTVATLLEMAWSSPTLLERASARRKRVFFVRSLKEARDRGSKGLRRSALRTTFRSQPGTEGQGLGRVIDHDLSNSLSTGEDEMSRDFHLKTVVSMDLYPLIQEIESFLQSCKYRRKSAILGIVGLDTEKPFSLHQRRYTSHLAW